MAAVLKTVEVVTLPFRVRLSSLPPIMTNAQKFEAGLLDDQYAEYIMTHCAGDRLICNGDMLLLAMEDGYLADDFLKSLE